MNTIEVEAASLEMAREQLQTQIPDGFVLISEKVINDGKPKTRQAQAETEEDAFSEAKGKRPENSRIIAKKVLVSSVNQDITYEAFNEKSATLGLAKAKRSFDSDVKLAELKIVVEGSFGFLGIGKKPWQYLANFRRDTTVEITFQSPVKISAEIGTPEEKLFVSETLASLKNRGDEECDAAIDQIAQLDPVVLSARAELYTEPLIATAWGALDYKPAAVKRANRVVPILVKMGDPALQILSEIKNTSQNRRSVLIACVALVKMGDPAHVTKARNEIYGKYAAQPFLDELRKEHADLMAKMGLSNGFIEEHPLFAVEKEESPFQKFLRGDEYHDLDMVKAMACIGDEDAVDCLANIILKTHPSEQVRTQAAWALGMIGAKSSIPALTEALNDLSWQNVRPVAQKALIKLRSIDN